MSYILINPSSCFRNYWEYPRSVLLISCFLCFSSWFSDYTTSTLFWLDLTNYWSILIAFLFFHLFLKSWFNFSSTNLLNSHSTVSKTIWKCSSKTNRDLSSTVPSVLLLLESVLSKLAASLCIWDSIQSSHQLSF